VHKRITKPTKIFLDLDDVLNSFTLPALGEVGCPVESFDYDKYDPEWGFDILCAANTLHREYAFTEAMFWSELSMTFWSTIPKSQECDWLLDLCESLVGRENLFILTASPEKVGDHVASAKVTWIRTHLPSWLQEQFLIGSCKQACASPDALLIDDSDENVDAFRRAGGEAILMPKPWNSLFDLEVYPYLVREIDNLFGPLRWMPWSKREAA